MHCHVILILTPSLFLSFSPPGYVWLTASLAVADESLDTREGVDLVLKCRFTEHYDSTDFTFYWARWTCCPTLFENVAIGDVQLNSNYR